MGGLDDPAGKAGRHRAAEPEYEGDDRFAVQPHPVHPLVEHQGEPGQEPGVFDQGEEEVERDDVRDDQRQGGDKTGPGTGPDDIGKRALDQRFDRCYGREIRDEDFRDPCTDQKRPDKEAANREGEEEVPEDRVEGDAIDSLREAGLHLEGRPDADNLPDQPFGRMVPFSAQDCCCRFAMDLLQFGTVLPGSPGRFRRRFSHLPDRVGVAFEQLDGRPAPGIVPGPFRQQRHDLPDTILDLPAVRDHVRTGSGFEDSNDRIGEFRDPFSLDGYGGNDRDTEDLPESCGVDADPFLRGKIHLVHGDDQGALQLGELEGEEEVPFQRGGIGDIDHNVRAVVGNKFAGDLLLGRERGDGVDPRKIDHADPFSPVLEETFRPFNRLARPVADVLVDTRQLVERRALAHIRVPGKGDNILPVITGISAPVPAAPAAAPGTVHYGFSGPAVTKIWSAMA